MKDTPDCMKKINIQDEKKRGEKSGLIINLSHSISGGGGGRLVKTYIFSREL